MTKVGVVIPLFNEVDIFDILINRLIKLSKSPEVQFSFYLIDDGSSDATPDKIKEICLNNPSFSGIFLSRNFGHQSALSAGLSYALDSDYIFVLDADLQDPPELVYDMLKIADRGFDVVYGIRRNRPEGFFLKISFFLFYRILNWFSDRDFPTDAGDFCLMSRRAAEHISNLKEDGKYIRGLRHWIGFNQIGIEYNRAERANGKTKYSLMNRFKFALDGIFSFTSYPTKLIFGLGVMTVLISLFYFLQTLYKKIFLNEVADGFTGIIFMIILFGGVQLVSIGILGEYLVRIFYQVKSRPSYIVKEIILNNSKVA